MIYSIVVLTFLLFSGCQTTPMERSTQKHHDVVKKHSTEKKVYRGLYSSFQFSSTLMTNKVLASEWMLKKQIYRWSDQELAEEKRSFHKRHGDQAQVFLSFYTPERKQNQLHKKDSKWQVFLIVDGRKYPGKVKKRRDLFDDIRAFFPDHNRWSKPYLVSFSLPTADLNNKKPKLLITGPIASAEVGF